MRTAYDVMAAQTHNWMRDNEVSSKLTTAEAMQFLVH